MKLRLTGRCGSMDVTPPSKKTKRLEMDGPDGGWAWCVALAACSVTFITAGLARISGILYVAFIDVFSVSRQEAAYPSSIRNSTKNLLGPLVGILGQQYGVRVVVLVGGVIASISAAACYFAPNMDFIVLLWGGLNGIGCALTVTLLQVVIGQHFKKHHSTASGLSFSGGCVGAFVFPVLIEFLLHTYGLQGTFLIMSAIMMHIIPAALILRKPAWMKNRRTEVKNGSQANGAAAGTAVASTEQDDDDEICQIARDTYPTDGIPDFTSDTQDEAGGSEKFFWYRQDKLLVAAVVFHIIRSEVNKELEALWAAVKENNSENKDDENDVGQVPSKVVEIVDKVYVTAMNIKADDLTESTCNNNANFGRSACTYGSENELECTFLKGVNNLPDQSVLTAIIADVAKSKSLSECSVKEILEEIRQACGLCLRAYEYTACEHVAVNIRSSNDRKESKVQEMSSIADARQSEVVRRSQEPSKTYKEGFKEHLKTALKLNCNPFFVLVCLCRVVHFVTFVPFVTVIVDFSKDKGLPEDDGKYVIAALSAGDLVGRVGFGWVTDRNCLSLPRFMLCAMVTHGAITATLPFVNARYLLMIAVALFGLFEGTVFIRHPVLISKFLQQKEQSIAMGCINFVPGLIGFGLPAYIGYFRDTLGSYDNMFFITGAISTAVGLLWLFEPQLSKCAPTEDEAESSYEESVVP